MINSLVLTEVDLASVARYRAAEVIAVLSDADHGSGYAKIGQAVILRVERKQMADVLICAGGAEEASIVTDRQRPDSIECGRSPQKLDRSV